MHQECRAFVQKRIAGLKPGRVLEVGSMDVNGSIRDLFAGWEYTGQDSQPGKNVDTTDPVYSVRLGLFDLVVCLNVLEHCPNPFTLVDDMRCRLLEGGLMLVTTPTSIPIHRHPIDAWRILPDGMQRLADDAGLKSVEIGSLGGQHNDTYMVARK